MVIGLSKDYCDKIGCNAEVNNRQRYTGYWGCGFIIRSVQSYPPTKRAKLQLVVSRGAGHSLNCYPAPHPIH